MKQPCSPKGARLKKPYFPDFRKVDLIPFDTGFLDFGENKGAKSPFFF